jgi:nicotinamide mononucleotide transporter
VFTPERLLEIFGLISGLACVWLMIRQNWLTFPIGLLYAVASVVVMARNHLYADVLLNTYYVLINAYGWWYWQVQKETRGIELPVTRTPLGLWWTLAGITLVGFFVLVYVLSNYTEAQLVYWNSATTILSFIAMWMSARKLLENWWLWLIVNTLSVGIYQAQGIYPYTLLYAVYLVMAVQGYRSWYASMQPPRVQPA